MLGIFGWVKALISFMAKEGVADRRRMPRYPCSYKVKWSIPDSPMLETEAVADNVSRVGVRLKLNRLLYKGEKIKMNIIEHRTNRIVQAHGIVRWSYYVAEKTKTVRAAGIEFINIDPFDVDCLVGLIPAVA